MYGIVILSFIVLAVLARDSDGKLCGGFLHPGQCCKQGNETVHKFITDNLKDCLLIPLDPIKCERLICIGKKKGYATDDGKIGDKNKFIEALNKDFETEPDLLEDVKSKCANGNLDMYGPPEFCVLAKARTCMAVQMLNHCIDWIDSADCKKVKENVDECIKITS